MLQNNLHQTVMNNDCNCIYSDVCVEQGLKLSVSKIDIATIAACPLGHNIQEYLKEIKSSLVVCYVPFEAYSIELMNILGFKLFEPKEFKFFTSTRVPNFVSPFNLIDILASHLKLPSSIFPSQTPIHLTSFLISVTNWNASSAE